MMLQFCVKNILVSLILTFLTRGPSSG